VLGLQIRMDARAAVGLVGTSEVDANMSQEDQVLPLA
jgi:hypothetical protein